MVALSNIREKEGTISRTCNLQLAKIISVMFNLRVLLDALYGLNAGVERL